MVMTAWPGTMECSFQLQIGTMIKVVVEVVQVAIVAVDGGTTAVIIHF